jgi:hypothetical protein
MPTFSTSWFVFETKAADQQNPDRGGHDTLATKAVREERINIAEHALKPQHP